MGGGYSDHAEWQIPVFDGANDQQDCVVQRRAWDSKLAYVANFATEAQPRGIRIDPTGQYLIASGEKSDRLSVYKIDQGTGKLSEPNRYPAGNGANWVEIVEVQ